MSASTPTARYIITATDTTAGAWRSSVKSAEDAARSISATRARIAGTFAGLGISVAATAFARASAQAIEWGDEIGKAAVKAGLAAKETQELAYAFGQFDVELPTVTKAIKAMQVTLSEAASGSKSAAASLAALGLSVTDLAKLNAAERMEVIADAIAKLGKEEDKTRALTELFGKAGLELAPAFEHGAAGVKAAREEFDRLNLALSDEQLGRLQDADDAAKQLKQSWGSFAATITSELAPALTKLFDMLSGGFTIAASEQGKLDQLRDVRSRQGALWNSDAVEAELRRRVKVLEAALHSGKISRPASDPEGPPGFSGGGAAGGGELPDHIKAAGDAAGNRHSTMREFDANVAYFEQVEEARLEAARAAAEEWRELGQDAEAGVMDGLRETAANAEAAFEQMLGTWQEGIDKQADMSEFAKEAARNMQDDFAAFLFDPFAEGLDGMLVGFLNTIRQMAAQAAAAKVFEALFGKDGSSGGGGNFLGAILGATFGGGKAEGGPLDPGKWYIAGEKGPEPIWGGGSGAFAAGYGDAGGGKVSVHAPLTIDARGATQDAVKTLVSALPGMFKQHGDMIESRIVQGIKRRRYGAL